ncbi:3-hydroxyisobutyryl-CoA hydrolase [Corynebacterium sp. 13CS0277]|uniref:enoyl-CoA hydratase/isomerase family protein n=1 Tax=Corynebacterium sp. 13CS0277 TaxID=2071994 RepID=UPI000D0450FA|nr:enoyl-CoA hydratase/isomerase family protein [Corynebacterium sp. 13CS0277]PRQ12458.1 3-hydroxyisobutyryl-CoA hydrolase [Corynebacterium sp. 13CS0277]
MSTTHPVLVSVRNSTGVLELNRPKALNSLNHEMITLISDALDAWENDDSIHRVVLLSTTERAFCAGGDVRAVRDAGVAGDYASGDRFFVDEYDMNDHLARFPKPIVAVINGVAMGGGLGVSCHGSHRVVTERAFAAMPEMAIGFIPDVGMTHMMMHMVGTRGAPSAALAKFLGVTGWRLNPAEMIASGMATHFVPAADVEDFTQMLVEESIDSALERYATEPAGEDRLAPLMGQIEEVFSGGTWQEIAAALAERATPDFAQLVEEHLAGACPTSVVAAIELFTANATVSLRHALDNELSLGSLMRRRDDFAEGVRAVLIDKDRNPHFQPADIEAVDPAPLRAVLH